MNNNKNILLLLFLLLALAASLFLVFRTTIFSGRATGTITSSIALENSYLFASPLQAKADGKEMVRITVFLLDGRGLGITNQPINLKYPGNISLKETQPSTDDSGKAVFDLSSPVTGKFEISASSNGKILPQKVRVVFY